MNDFKGTKGKLSCWLGSTSFRITDQQQRDILNIEEIGDIDEVEANAKLLMVAPEMLEALVKCKSVLQDNLKAWQYKNEEMMLEAYKQAEETINKALGL